jgi:hypothetical protein
MPKKSNIIDWSKLPDKDRSEKPSPVSENLVKSIIGAIDDLKSQVKEDSAQSKVLSDNLVDAANTMAEVGRDQIESKTVLQDIDKKHKWNMEVNRDRRGLIKSIEVEEI